MSADFKLEGMDDFMRNLDALKDRKSVNRKAKSAARKAMQLVQMAAMVGAARINDPETKESIQQNIAIRSGKSRDLNTVVMRVGVLGGAKNYANTKDNVRKGRAGKEYATDGSSKNPGGDTFYWRYIEFGTSRFPAVPFMRPALSENIERVTAEFNKHFMKSIETAIKKGKIT
ncbi:MULTISPECIES: HK97-gp10 family putative phage morphogenesis protein [unclassified Acinetobacter]|uniref:HK97 gp10 family phage protein n=2 Tax=Acinetobacter tianfuensis TaxID=2419603 RepID=A0A3A8ERI1_9GAMM|nr:HK97-gp10 family putative phage morphogenesis protein [Acinetobacter sp. FL51]MBI1450331.1 HK97 gp10 family phage protein [Acinetobacter sp. FL51]RKG31491.1 hypothetical protein D7V32_08485 [Acinetobacter tianfuensis]